MRFEDLILEYSQRSGDDLIYTVVQTMKAKGCEAAWLKVQAGRHGIPVWMLRCRCYFTEEIGWKRDISGRRISLLAPVSPHVLYVIEQKHKELRRELAHLGKEGLVIELIARAVRGAFVGEDGGRSGYGISIHTITAVSGWPFEQTLSVVRKLVANSRLVNMSEDVVGLP